MTGHLVDPLQHLAFRRDFTLADMECRKGVAIQQLICACTGNAEHFRKLFGVQHFGITVKSIRVHRNTSFRLKKIVPSVFKPPMVAADLLIRLTGCSFPVPAFTEHTRVIYCQGTSTGRLSACSNASRLDVLEQNDKVLTQRIYFQTYALRINDVDYNWLVNSKVMVTASPII